MANLFIKKSINMSVISAARARTDNLRNQVKKTFRNFYIISTVNENLNHFKKEKQ